MNYVFWPLKSNIKHWLRKQLSCREYILLAKVAYLWLTEILSGNSFYISATRNGGDAMLIESGNWLLIVNLNKVLINFKNYNHWLFPKGMNIQKIVPQMLHAEKLFFDLKEFGNFDDVLKINIFIVDIYLSEAFPIELWFFHGIHHPSPNIFQLEQFQAGILVILCNAIQIWKLNGICEVI